MFLCLFAAIKSPAGCGQDGAGGITNIPTLGGNNFNIFVLTSSGGVGGYSSLPGEQLLHGFIYTNGMITDVGTLGGTMSEVRAMNGSNQASGFSGTPGDSEDHAFLFSNGTLADLGTLGGTFSIGMAVNDAGQVAGAGTTASGSEHAFLYSGGVMKDLGSLGGDFSTAAGINSSGTVTGDSFSASFDNFAFIYSNGVMTSLGDLGSGVYSSSRGINDAGMIAGESSDSNSDVHAFLYSNGVMKDLGTLGGNSSTAVALNNAGQVIGTSVTSDGSTHGFIYDGTNMIDLGSLGGDQSEAFAINNSGMVVGDAMTGNSEFHAFLWQNGAMTDLNSLLPTNSDWVLSSAQNINDAGQIVGFGSLNGTFQWFIMSLAASNSAPVAVAGPDQTVDCQTSVTLDGSASSDPDGDPIKFQWTESAVVLGTNSTLTASFDLGDHVITLTVTDPCGASGQTNVTVHVVDNTPPVIVGGPGPITVSANGNCLGATPNVVPQIVATDNCTAASALVITQNPTAGTLLGLGQHQIIVTVKDASGNSVAGSTFFTVADTTPPVIVSSPGPITVSADGNGVAAVPNVTGSIVASDSCTPASSLVITQNPAAGTSLGLGNYSIMVTVKDAAGNPANANVSFSVVDTTPPVIVSVPGAITVPTDANCQGVVPNVLSNIVATDNCTPAGLLVMTQNPAAGTVLGSGQYSIIVTVKDASGNATAAGVPFAVVNKTPPVFQSLTVTPSVLWPPNNKFVPVTVSAVVTDGCDPAPITKIVRIKSNDPDCDHDKDSNDGIQITGNLTAKLLASHNDQGRRRVYTIFVCSTDASGNSTTAEVTVTVPKSNGDTNDKGKSK